jgi:hypothetical protein
MAEKENWQLMVTRCLEKVQMSHIEEQEKKPW